MGILSDLQAYVKQQTAAAGVKDINDDTGSWVDSNWQRGPLGAAYDKVATAATQQFISQLSPEQFQQMQKEGAPKGFAGFMDKYVKPIIKVAALSVPALGAAGALGALAGTSLAPGAVAGGSTIPSSALAGGSMLSGSGVVSSGAAGALGSGLAAGAGAAAGAAPTAPAGQLPAFDTGVGNIFGSQTGIDSALASGSSGLGSTAGAGGGALLGSGGIAAPGVGGGLFDTALGGLGNVASNLPSGTPPGAPTGGTPSGAAPPSSGGGLLDTIGNAAGNMGWEDWAKLLATGGALGNSIFGQADAPQGPDYKALAEQQAQANHPNQTNAAGDSSSWTFDPATGQWSQQQKFGSANQGLFDLANQTKSNLLGQAAGQGQLSTEGMPSLGGIVMDPQGSNEEITQAWLARMNPQLENQRKAELQRLANMGITENRAGGANTAYENAMDRLNRNEVDATNQALIYGTNAYNQTFQNSLGADSANRSNQGQMFNQAKTINDQPYNQLQALTGVTPQNPIFGNTGGGTDYYGAGQDQYAQQLAQANAKNAASNNLTQGLWGLAKGFTPPPGS